MSAISDSIRDTGLRLAVLPDDQFVAGVSNALAALFPAFTVAPATIYDQSGTSVGPLDSVISLTPIENGMVAADSVACAVYIRPSLNAQTLAEGYERIAQVKALQKTPSTEPQRSTITLGLIVARSAPSLDGVADELRSLNREIPDDHRPDMIAMLMEGTANYLMHFLGDDERVGAFLPPARGVPYVAPILVMLTTNSTKSHALNNLVGFIIGHMAFFAPGRNAPIMKAVLEGVPKHSTVACTYQYNLARKLVEVAAVPSPIHPYVIEDGNRNRLLRIQFQPWQDGGVVVAEGKLPLLGLLAVSGRKMELNTFPSSHGRHLSSVLPMDGDGFVEMMSQVAKRSKGMTVRKESPQFTVAKMLDEGTSSPFGARILMTPLTLRDLALTDKSQIAKFDEVYQFIINHLIDLRSAARELTELWNGHVEKLSRGESAYYQNGVHVTEPIEQRLHKLVQSLIMDASRVAKKVQKLAAIFGIAVGFLFQKKPAYERGLQSLEKADPQLAAYARESRKWLEPLRLMRDELEHGTFVPPKLRYAATDDGIRVDEPSILGLRVTDYARVLLSRLNRFVEEVLAWCIQRGLPDPLMLTEITAADRDPVKVERFRVTIKGQGEEPWAIVYSEDDFDQV